MRNPSACLCVILFAATALGQAPEPHTLVTFKKITLTDKFHAEGAGIGDFNKDGKADVFYGKQWYAGPDFKAAHAIDEVKTFDPKKYSNNFMTEVHDVDGDGYDDVLINEWPGKAVHWYRNPAGKGETWKKHVAFPNVDNEAPQFGDLTGDGKPELVFHHKGRLGYAKPGADPTQPWSFHAISEKGKWQRYSHGLGFGDIDGDKRPEFLMAQGWWRRPASGKGLWKKHPVPFGAGGAQMYTYDVDGDGDMDVITSLAAHGYGLAWFEHVKQDGKIVFTKHLIMGSKPSDNPYGVKFSQLHAVGLADIDGDGLKDIVTGKRFWAHGPKKDAEPNAPAVVYWFRLTRTKEGVHYIPYKIDDDSGVGTQFAIGDVNGDGRPDIVTGNKKGGYVFVQNRQKVSKEQWEKAQPKRLGVE
ncbi:MAG: VCBS repeat-containing protein [Phycisphaeraceae bacterium]|nr:VCBS repeat-containing protein [Phycisphaeraceae bacterium]